jgi:hypothetical protein
LPRVPPLTELLVQGVPENWSMATHDRAEIMRICLLNSPYSTYSPFYWMYLSNPRSQSSKIASSASREIPLSIAEHNTRTEGNRHCSRADGIRASRRSSGNRLLRDARGVRSSPRWSFLSQSAIVK